MLVELTVLEQGWINCGWMKKVSVTIKPIFRAQEVGVTMKVYLNNAMKSVEKSIVYHHRRLTSCVHS